MLLLGVLLLVGLWSERSLPLGGANPSPQGGAIKKEGEPERGRSLFNGKGICSHCHGVDGHIDQRPEMSPSKIEALAHLDPKPANLRDPNSLQLKTDTDRFEAIRHGHLRTAMFAIPSEILTDDDIHDILAYLATLRREGCRNTQGCKGDDKRQHTTIFYDAHGEPSAYMQDGTNIYLVTGEPVAYVDSRSVYSFRGHHLGWYIDGWVWDRHGQAVLFTSGAIGGPALPKRRELPGIPPSLVLPPRTERQMQSGRPGLSSTWSSLSPLDFFRQ